MARKQKHAEHPNHERWLVSYADFITLLFAFFVVMFAVSQVDSKKMGRFSESFAKAVGIEVFPESGQSLISGSAEKSPVQTKDGQGDDILPPELVDIKATLTEKAKRDDDLKGVVFLERRNELVLRLPESVVFASGDDRLKERAVPVLREVVEQIRGKKIVLRVEGHTDNVPISTPRFRSNWELSTARATSVIAELAKQHAVPPQSLSAAGYGEFHPVADNATSEGRAQNRRVDLVIAMEVKPAS